MIQDTGYRIQDTGAKSNYISEHVPIRISSIYLHFLCLVSHIQNQKCYLKVEINTLADLAKKLNLKTEKSIDLFCCLNSGKFRCFLICIA